jgi:two-component system response regulator AlgR
MRTLIVDDEPLAIERMQILCARIPALQIVGTAADGAAALRLVEALSPQLVLLDMTMPELDGLGVARALVQQDPKPMVIFVTAHDHFAVEAFDCEAVDYVLKPVAQDRLERAVERALARQATLSDAAAALPATSAPTTPAPAPSSWIEEFWVPHRSELVRVAAADIDRIDAERDYVRLHVGPRSYLMLHTIQRLEDRLDPAHFIRLHRSTIVRRSRILGLRHDGLGCGRPNSPTAPCCASAALISPRPRPWRGVNDDSRPRRHPAIAQCLGHVHAADVFRAGQVGNGAGHAQDAGIAARRKPHRLGRLEQQLPSGLVGRGKALQQVAVQFGIVAPSRAFQPGGLAGAGGGHPRGDLLRSFRRGGRARSAAETGSTSTCRSMRSSSGPDTLDW